MKWKAKPTAGMEESSDYNAELQILSENILPPVIIIARPSGSAASCAKAGATRPIRHDIYPVRAVDTTAGSTYLSA